MAASGPYQQPEEGPQPPTQSRASAAQAVGADVMPVEVAEDRLATAIRAQREGASDGEELTTLALKNTPPWLFSAVFHMVVLIVLALSWTALQPQRQIYLSASVTGDEEIFAERLGEQLELDSLLGQDMVDLIQDPVLTSDDLLEVDDPFAVPPNLENFPDGTTATSELIAKQIGLALTGREEGSKESLLQRYGGTATTEAAVARGLAWLAGNQGKDGSWSLIGPYRDGARIENRSAATAMALLAFQGAGHTHQKGKYRKNVVRGWKWLLGELDADGNFYHGGALNHRFYTQGQCTIALCELYGMTKDPKYKEPARRATEYCLRSQSREGGWRYYPNSDSDVSVTVWVGMALQSARMAGLEVPEDHLQRVGRYLDEVGQYGGSRYPYQRDGRPTPTMTAEGLLCRQYLGWARNDERLVRGVQWITQPENLIDYGRNRNVYYWYYATQVAHHMEGEYWKRWNSVMRQAVPAHQNRDGRESGSWDPNNRDMHESHGGRLYTTCLSIYMLEVYYRHLPLYTKVYHNLLNTER